MIDMIGHHLGLTAFDRGEHIAIGHKAEPLLPRIIARGEMGFYVITLGQFLGHHAKQHLTIFRRIALRRIIEKLLHEDVFEAGDIIGQPFGKDLAQRVGKAILGGAGHIISGRTLEHGNMANAAARHCGNNRHSGCAAADNDNILTRIVEVFRPELRMKYRPLEILTPGKFGDIGIGIAIIASAHVEEGA